MHPSNAKSRFVIHQHVMPDGTHWDLMLEKGDKLWTWRIDIHPAEIRQAISAERIFDHPLKFLTYEGPVQNGTGNVIIADKGDYCLQDIDADKITLFLTGRLLNGRFTMQIDEPPVWIFSPVKE